MIGTGIRLNDSSAINGCKGYIRAHTADGEAMPYQPATLPSVTISCETGAGALSVGKLLLEQMQLRRTHEKPWTLFETNIVERVIEEHQLPENIKRFMPEDAPFELTNALEELLGLHPGSWTLLQYTTDTMIRLASAGHAIIIGRGSSMITSRLPNMIHVRLVGSAEQRIRHIQEYYSLSRKEAELYVQKTDKARSRFVQKYFNTSINDPHHYDMILNTDVITYADAAGLIADAAMRLCNGTAPVTT